MVSPRRRRKGTPGRRAGRQQAVQRTGVAAPPTLIIWALQPQWATLHCFSIPITVPAPCDQP